MSKPDLPRLFHALGDPTRRSIVERLSRGPLPASQLAVPLAITLTAVIQHLAVLERSGLVRTEKEGRVRTCRLDPTGLAAVERWAQTQRTAWEKRLDRLAAIVDE
jgi:DNA-binding transcriptional ArsR family regulator